MAIAPRFKPRAAVPQKVIVIHAPAPKIPQKLRDDDDTFEVVDNSYKGTMERYKAKIKNPITAIRSHCVHCCCGQLSEVANCTAKGCSLHPFRMGKNPLHGKSKARQGEVQSGDDAEESDE